MLTKISSKTKFYPFCTP